MKLIWFAITKGKGTVNEITNTSPAQNQKNISISEFTDEDIEEMLDKAFKNPY